MLLDKPTKNNSNIEIISTNDGGEQWDAIIRNLSWRNLYQSYKWGEIKREAGWHPVRIVVKDDKSRVVSAAQVLIKKRFGCVVKWVPGGPLFNHDFDYNENAAAILGDLYEEDTILKYIRIYPMKPHHERDAAWLADKGWQRPSAPFHKSITIMLDIEDRIDIIRARLKKKWRYDLKRSEGLDHRFRALDNKRYISVFADAHNEMCRKKRLKEEMVPEELLIMKERLGDDLLIGAAFENSLFTSGWAIAMFLDTAYVLKAVTTERGRDTRASYFCLWEAIKYLKNKGCRRIEMGGIDPDGNKGVTHFKRGLGGDEIMWLGEWERTNNRLVSMAINRLIA